MTATARDSIYTPARIAMRIAGAMPDGLTGSVLDPAAGEGALLEGVVSAFGARVKPLAIDIDPGAVAVLKQYEGWLVSEANTLSPASRRASRAWRVARSELAAVVVNPPFSRRGNGGVWTTFEDFSGRVSPALAFLGALLSDLSPREGFWAILPDGALHALKHQLFWEAVRSTHDVRIVEEFDQYAFPGARVSTALVHIGPYTLRFQDAPVASRPKAASCERPAECVCVEVIRGRVSVHRAGEVEYGERARFVHTTDIGGRRGRSVARTASARLADFGPFVVLPRVGRWIPPVLLEAGPVVLSDCLIALRPRSSASMRPLMASLAEAEDNLRELYRGTGAKYTTVDKVRDALRDIGWTPHLTRAGVRVAECTCGDGANRVLGESDVG